MDKNWENWESRCLKARKKRDKLRGMIEYLCERDADAFGGYPYDFKWIGRTLAVASLYERGGTKLVTYTRKELLRWFDRARRFHKKHKEIHDFSDSVALTARPHKATSKKPARNGSTPKNVKVLIVPRKAASNVDTDELRQ
jgi:hypothetical protein